MREQLDILVNNHNNDISKEIKRHLVEHTALNLKIKEMNGVVFDKEKLLEELSSENYSLNRKNRQLEASVKSLEDKISLLLNQLITKDMSENQANSGELEEDKEEAKTEEVAS